MYIFLIVSAFIIYLSDGAEDNGAGENREESKDRSRCQLNYERSIKP